MYEFQRRVTPGGRRSCVEPLPLHVCREGLRHRVYRPHCTVLGRAALAVGSPVPARTLLPARLLLAPAFSSVQWVRDEMVPELLSTAGN